MICQFCRQECVQNNKDFFLCLNHLDLIIVFNPVSRVVRISGFNYRIIQYDQNYIFDFKFYLETINPFKIVYKSTQRFDLTPENFRRYITLFGNFQ